MKILKKQGLTFMLIAALVVTLTLGIIFMLPAKTAKADDDVFQGAASVEVSTEQQLKDEVEKAATTAKKIVLKNDIEMNSISKVEGGKYYELVISRGQKIQLDLAGHKLSSIPNSRNGYVIFNCGILSIVDSSEDNSGKILSQGHIYADYEYDEYDWSQTSVIYNYGDLTIDANIALEKPESKGEMGSDGFYNYTDVYTESVMIESFPYIPSADEVDQVASNSSVTVNGGTFSGISATVFGIHDADLTINGGKFTTLFNDSEMSRTYLFKVGAYFRDTGEAYLPAVYYDDDYVAHIVDGEQKYIDAELQLQQEIVEKLKNNRHSNVQINDGDFTAYTSKSNILNINTNIIYLESFGDNGYGYPDYKQAVVENAQAEIAVTISGGKWGTDLSMYVPQGKSMKHIYEVAQDGSVMEDYYEVAPVDMQQAVVILTVNGKDVYFYSFDEAFSAAKKVKSSTRTLKLLKNTQTEKLALNLLNGDLILDLNGKKLIIEPSTDTPHIEASDVYNYVNRLIIRDTSDNQTGELILSVKSGGPRNKGGFISIGLFTKYVLESGTILQTGYLPESYYTSTPDQFGQSDANMNFVERQSLFYITTHISDANVQKYEGAVTIKGGNIISNLTFGTQDHIVGQHAGQLVAWSTNTTEMNKCFEFGLDDGDVSSELKARVFALDLKDYLSDGIKSCKFSWDFKDIVTNQGLTSNASGNEYIVSKVNAGEYFIVGSTAQKVSTLQAALEAAAENDTISVLQNATVTEAVTINKGISLNLNAVANFQLTFEQGFTLSGGASIHYGNIIAQDAVTVAGDATFDSVTLNGDITVSGGTLSILSGTYNGEFTVNGEGGMAISGGSFKGSEIEDLDQYFGEHLGAFDLANKDFNYQKNPDKLYSVQFGPDIHAQQEWYKKFSDEYEIETTDDWLSFSLFVNSGLDDFKDKTVKLTKELNFDPNAKNGIALVADAKVPNFMPAGNAKHAFAGTFNGANKTISNIVAQEQFVGLFGQTTGDARFNNINIIDSTFMIGSGYLEEFFPEGSHWAAGAIVGEGYMYDIGNDGKDWSGNITLNNVKVGVAPRENASIFDRNYVGGVIGHSWGDVKIDGLNFQNATTVSSNWKMGGIVGYLDGEFYIKKADIEEGTKNDGSDNGLILDNENCFFASGALVGHANGSNNTIEDCKVLEPDDSLIGTTYAGGTDSRITIKGSETELDIYRVVGAGRAEGSTTEVELSQEVTEEGVKRGSVKLQETENGMKFYEEKDGKKTPLEVQPNADGGFEAVAKLDVTIGKIVVPVMTYSATEAKEATLTSFVLYNELGNMLDNEEYQYLKNLTVVVTLQLSKSTVGKQMALITSYTITGADANKYTFQLTGNQTFIEVEVTAKTLQVSVNGNGEVEYDGFVGGENESVLGGSLTLDKVDNGDGTYTVTPSGLESENYNIVYVSSVVPAAAFETESNALWIALAVVGSAVLLLAAFAVVYTVRKRKE